MLLQSAVTTPPFKIKKEAKETPLTTTKTNTVSILNIYPNIIHNCPYLTLHWIFFVFIFLTDFNFFLFLFQSTVASTLDLNIEMETEEEKPVLVCIPNIYLDITQILSIYVQT